VVSFLKKIEPRKPSKDQGTMRSKGKKKEFYED